MINREIFATSFEAAIDSLVRGKVYFITCFKPHLYEGMESLNFIKKTSFIEDSEPVLPPLNPFLTIDDLKTPEIPPKCRLNVFGILMRKPNTDFLKLASSSG